MFNSMDEKIKIISIFLLSLCVAGAFVPAASPRDSFAPNWLKEGTYATYTINQSGNNQGSSALIFDTSNPDYKGLNCWNASGYNVLAFWNASLTWRCVNINDTVAKLEITFNYIGDELLEFVGKTEPTRTPLNNASLQITGEAYIDLYTREIFSKDGVLLGTTQLWLPANPSDGQDVTVWDAGPDKIVLQAQTNNVWFQSTQGKQDGFFAQGTQTIGGKTKNFNFLCDLDTGFNTVPLQWDPIMAAIGIHDCSFTTLSDTNVNLGSTDTSLNWTVILQYAILPIAAALLCGAVLIRRKKNKR